MNGNNYVEGKVKWYIIHASENIILRERKEPKSSRTQYQVQNKTKIRKKTKSIKKDID